MGSDAGDGDAGGDAGEAGARRQAAQEQDLRHLAEDPAARSVHCGNTALTPYTIPP